MNYLKKKVVFIGGKQIGVNCLKILLENKIRPELVIPNKDDTDQSEEWHDSLTKVAEESQLKVYRNSLKDEETKNKIYDIKPDIIFCIGSNAIVPDSIIQIPKEKTINIHPALLPKYRGRFSTVYAIFNGDNKTGVTLQYINKLMDAGPVIFQREFSISNADTAKDVYDNFTKVGTELFINFIDDWINNRDIVSVDQDESISSVCRGLPNNGNIDWNWDGQKILRFIRSMTFPPFPPVNFMIGDRKMVIIEEKYFKGYK